MPSTLIIGAATGYLKSLSRGHLVLDRVLGTYFIPKNELCSEERHNSFE